MKIKTLLLTSTVALSAVSASQASVVISSLNDTATFDFNAFTGAGLEAAPAAGQLDSDTWRIVGLSDGDTTFGGSFSTGDFARGTDSDGVSTGGLYAFETSTGNFGLGVQGAGSDFTPGTFTLRILNDTGSTVSSWNLSYSLFVLNDQGRSNSWDWGWSTDDTTYNSLSTFTSTEAADGTPTWSNVQSPSSTGVSATVADGDFLYLQWSSDDVGGSGSRDEFAIDDVSITAVPEPSAALLGAFGMLALLRRRR